MDSSLRVIFLAHPRSGSSSLYQILQLHPALNILEEPFNENFPNWSPRHKNYREQVSDISSLDIQLADIFTLHNGIKILDYQLPDDLMLHLLQRHNCKIIFLRRKNLLQSVVSVLIAEQTKLWKKWEMLQPLEGYYRDLRPLDVYDIQQRVKTLKNRLDFLESFIDTLPENMATKLIYEELYFVPPARRNAQIAALWNFLKILPLESDQINYYLEPAKVKINSSTTYELIPNAQEIQQQCGNDLTGWLYEK
jgi:hypothetical protein